MINLWNGLCKGPEDAESKGDQLSILGESYPFFIQNRDGDPSYYLYQVNTCSMGDRYYSKKPLLYLKKISERLHYSPRRKDNWDIGNMDIYKDILRMVNRGTGYNLDGYTFDYVALNTILNRNNNRFSDGLIKSDEVYKMSKEQHNRFGCGAAFVDNGTTPKLVIVGIRDILRWNQFVLKPGNKVDILVSRNVMVLYDVKSDASSGSKEGVDSNNIYLTPINAYRKDDVEFKNPIGLKFLEDNGVKYEVKGKFSGERKESDLNRVLRQIEWNSFNNLV